MKHESEYDRKCHNNNREAIGFLKTYFCPIEIIKGLTDKGTVSVSHKIKGASRGNLPEAVFCLDFQPFGGFDLFVTGRSVFLLSERSLSFNNVMITLTSARPSARTVELASEYNKISYTKVKINILS